MDAKAVVRVLFAGVLAGVALTGASDIALADPWDPWIPGIPNIAGPGVNIGVPGNPLPPGQVKHAVDDLIPNFGPPGRWR